MLSWDTVRKLINIRKIDSLAVAGLSGVPGSLAYKTHAIQESMGSAVVHRTVTAKLHVSANGDGTDGKSPATAYTTIQDALAAASTNANDLTLILTAPGTYDINVTGNPTYTGNYIFKGSHRLWTVIKNDHGSATSIMKFTGLIGLEDLCFDLGTGNNGVIVTKSGFRVRKIIFDGTSLTGAATALHIDGATTIKHGRMENIDFAGHVTHMTGLLLDNASRNHIDKVHIHDCLKAIQIINGSSVENYFNTVDIGDCALGLDLDAGSEQHFETISFHDNVDNIDDEVGNHKWNNLIGEFDITIEPDNFAGVVVATGGAGGAWSAAPVEVRAAASSPHKPFKVVAYHLEADAAEKFRVRFSAGGGIWFDDIMIEGEANAVKREAGTAPTATDFVFNKGTQIVAESKCESGGNSVNVWIEIQEI